MHKKGMHLRYCEYNRSRLSANNARSSSYTKNLAVNAHYSFSGPLQLLWLLTGLQIDGKPLSGLELGPGNAVVSSRADIAGHH